MHEPLTDEPLVRRKSEELAELLLERGERTIGLARQLLDGHVLEDVVEHELLEALLLHVDVVQDLALDATVVVRDDVVDQLRHLDVLGRVVVAELLVAQVAVQVGEERADARPSGRTYELASHAPLAVVLGVDSQTVGDVEMHEDALQFVRTVVDHDLLERLALFGHVLDVVVTDSQKKDLTLPDPRALIAVVNVLRSAQYVSDRITRQILRLNSVV